MTQTPAIGTPAPGFTLPGPAGEPVSLADFAGRKVVLYFYPKDDTSGCTAEAQGFTAEIDAFAAAGAVVLGVSKDPVKKHDKFVQKYDLKVTLLSDEHSSLCETWGVWAEKSMYGKKYFGIERSTFLIDGTGVLRAEWRGVKVPGHVAAVLAAVRAL